MHNDPQPSGEISFPRSLLHKCFLQSEFSDELDINTSYSSEIAPLLKLSLDINFSKLGVKGLVIRPF